MKHAIKLSKQPDPNVSVVQTMEYVVTVLSTIDTPFINQEAMIERCIMFLNDAIKVAKEDK